MLTREQLAELVLKTLDTQRRFFRTRDNAVLEESKRLERELRAEAERISEGPSLFDREDA